MTRAGCRMSALSYQQAAFRMMFEACGKGHDAFISTTSPDFIAIHRDRQAQLPMTQLPASIRTRSRMLCGLVVFALFCGTAIAGKSDGDDHNGKQKKHKDNKDKHSEVVRVVEVPVGGYFVPQQQGVVTHYYVEHYKSGRCPPGLVKKGHKCKAPKLKKWKKGQPLPVSVVYYPVPQILIQQIGPPPQGYRYVRVDNDLLLLATGSQMVIDAIENLLGQ